MGKVYVAPFDIADAGTDADQDIFVLLTAASEKATVLGWEVYSNAIAAAVLKLELVSRTGIGTGGTAITEEDKDRAQNDTSTATVTSDAETPGTGDAVYENYYWEQLGPLVHKPVPEDRYTVDVSSVYALNLLTNPANSAFGGWISWLEH